MSRGGKKGDQNKRPPDGKKKNEGRRKGALHKGAPMATFFQVKRNERNQEKGKRGIKYLKQILSEHQHKGKKGKGNKRETRVINLNPQLANKGLQKATRNADFK